MIIKVTRTLVTPTADYNLGLKPECLIQKQLVISKAVKLVKARTRTKTVYSNAITILKK